MFPFRSCFRLIFKFCLTLIAASTAFYAFWLLAFLPDVDLKPKIIAESVQFTGALYHQETIRSLRSRLNMEWYYRKKLAQLTSEEIRQLSETYHRSVEIQWGSRSLLPTSKPLFDIMCFDYMENSYNFSVSIVITYYNELSVLLMRLLTTIKHRTPSKYVKEVVLINDNSSINITHEIYGYARDQDIPLVYLHNDKRLGIANSRRKGVMAASGNIIILLDSHMEVFIVLTALTS